MLLHCPNLLSISPGANISLQQGQHGDPSATQSRDRGSLYWQQPRTAGGLDADGSERAFVGTGLAWKVEGRNKAPREAMQSSPIFHGVCSPACNRDVLPFKTTCLRPLCANEFNTCIYFGAVTPDLRWQMQKARPASCPVILIHLHHLGATS